MATTQSASVLLTRVLQLKESSPLILIQDTIAQSSYSLIQHFLQNMPTQTNLIYVSFETPIKPIIPNVEAAYHFIEAYSLPIGEIVQEIEKFSDQVKKNLVLIDSINFVDDELISKFLTSIIRPNVTVLTTFHTSLPESKKIGNTGYYYPHGLRFLQFIASSIFELLPNGGGSNGGVLNDDEFEEIEKELNGLKIRSGLNSQEVVLVNFINRRKSGRSMNYKFQMNLINNEYQQIITQQQDGSDQIQDFSSFNTTFNLNTSAKQKLARDSVELPYLDAQNFENGGAIVYEFEKDDDYDEEDPYEDPF